MVHVLMFLSPAQSMSAGLLQDGHYLLSLPHTIAPSRSMSMCQTCCGRLDHEVA